MPKSHSLGECLRRRRFQFEYGQGRAGWGRPGDGHLHGFCCSLVFCWMILQLYETSALLLRMGSR